MKTMKSLSKIILFSLVLTAGCSQVKYTNNDSYYNDQRNTFSELDYYGHWINVQPFGDVWQPNVDYDWQPYEAGQWQLTDRGWMWFSDEPYGWIVYHYGYWTYSNAYGWVWIPGYEWYPSRVRWITYNDYIGWAPLPPNGYNLPGLYDNNSGRYWMIVHAKDFDNNEITKYRVSVNSIGQTRDWNYEREPEANYIRRESGRNIPVINTQTDNVRGGTRDLTRIRIRDNNQNGVPSQPQNNNFIPPPISRTSPQGNTNTNNRTDNGGRNVNKNPNAPTVQEPVKTRGDLVTPNPVERKPIQKENELNNERKIIPHGQPIRNQDSSKSGNREMMPAKKPINVDNIKKGKKEEKKLKENESKKAKPDETKGRAQEKNR